MGRDLECIRGCGTVIYFDDASKTSTGKKIPLERATGKPHNCPNNPYNNKNQVAATGGQPLTLIIEELKTKIVSLEDRVAKLEMGQSTLGKFN